MNLLPAIETEVPGTGPISAAVIWLHGLGADGNDFAALVPQLDLSPEVGVRFIFPHAPSIPVTINNGYVMPAWYDILSLDIDRALDAEQLMASASAVHAFVDREIERGIDSQRIIVAGFSQGGAVAYQAALSYAEPLGGILALSTYFATVEQVQIHSSNAQIPIMIGHGTQDGVVPELLAQSSQSALRGLGFDPDYRTYPMEHALCLEEISDISQWLNRVLSR